MRAHVYVTSEGSSRARERAKCSFKISEPGYNHYCGSFEIVSQLKISIKSLIYIAGGANRVNADVYLNIALSLSIYISLCR